MFDSEVTHRTHNFASPVLDFFHDWVKRCRDQHQTALCWVPPTFPPNLQDCPGGDIGVNFEILGDVTNIEVIAVGSSIREVQRLRKAYGSGRWRKLKGIATISLDDGSTYRAELHWYEAHGIGKKEFKIKRFLE
jgi:hypothetical protein